MFLPKHITTLKLISTHSEIFQNMNLAIIVKILSSWMEKKAKKPLKEEYYKAVKMVQPEG